MINIFGQPIKLLAYSKILSCQVYKGRNFYNINNLDLLEYISIRPHNAFKFLCCYIEKVLSDSGIFIVFQNFFNNPNKNNFYHLKKTFSKFTIDNTPIEGETECNRIFTKVINPLACKYHSLGTVRGQLSHEIITTDMIVYNQRNWRDLYKNKPKGLTRQEFDNCNNCRLEFDKMSSYNISKAKKYLRKFNDKYRDGKTEAIFDKQHLMEKASQMHHIFPAHTYPEISDYLENLICLSPTQHFSYAHPNNNTHYIDKLYQYWCIIAKSEMIKNNLNNNTVPTIYSFQDFLYVLDIGLETSDFSKIDNMDFNQIYFLLDYIYYVNEINSEKNIYYLERLI